MGETGIRAFGALRAENRRRAIEMFHAVRASQTTTIATYAAVTNASKAIVWPGGNAIIIVSVSDFATTAGNQTGYRLTDGTTVLAGGSNVWTHFQNTVSRHHNKTFVQLVTLPRGAYTVQLEWANLNTSGTLESDSNDIIHGVILPVF